MLSTEDSIRSTIKKIDERSPLWKYGRMRTLFPIGEVSRYFSAADTARKCYFSNIAPKHVSAVQRGVQRGVLIALCIVRVVRPQLIFTSVKSRFEENIVYESDRKFTKDFKNCILIIVTFLVFEFNDACKKLKVFTLPKKPKD